MKKIQYLREQWMEIQKEQTELNAKIKQFQKRASLITKEDLSEVSLEAAESFIKDIRYGVSEEQHKKWTAIYEKRLRKEAPGKEKLCFPELRKITYLSTEQMWAIDRHLSCMGNRGYLYYGPLCIHTHLSYASYQKLLTDLKEAGIIELLYRWDCPRGEPTAIVSEQEYAHAMKSEEAFEREGIPEEILNNTCNLCDWEELCEDGQDIRKATNREEFQKIFQGAERIGRMSLQKTDRNKEK